LAITIKDPLFFLRQSINENNLYCFRINNFLFLSCYDEEEEVKSDDL
jgi:hypothetical protein